MNPLDLPPTPDTESVYVPIDWNQLLDIAVTGDPHRAEDSEEEEEKPEPEPPSPAPEPETPGDPRTVAMELVRELAKTNPGLAGDIMRGFMAPPPPPSEEETAEARERAAERAREAERLAAVEKEKDRLRAQRDARKALDEEEFSGSFQPPRVYASGAEGYAVERPPIVYAVDKLAVKGQNILITAGFKVGKTDLMQNLVRAYADGEPFLGAFGVLPLDPDRTVVMLDFELDEDYSWNLLKNQAIKRPERMNMLNMVGVGWNLSVDGHYEWLTRTLIEMRAQVLVVDPFGAAFTGEENANSEVRAWLRLLDRVKRDVGIRELYLTTHTGRAQAEEGQERARGATVLNDWAAVFWNYNKDTKPGTTTPANYRFLSATGRGVSVEEFAVQWEAATQHLTVIEGSGSRDQMRQADLARLLLGWIKDHPDSSTKTIKDNVKGKSEYIDQALGQLAKGDAPMVTITKGANRANLWKITSQGEWLLSKS